MDWNYTASKLPEKGKDIEYISPTGSTGFAFRCACHNQNCKEWRCSLTGYGLMWIDIDKWKYVN